MKKVILVLITVSLVAGFNSCKKTTSEVNAALCNDGILDGAETEIDCGGNPCTPCPPTSTFACIMTGGLPIPGGQQNLTEVTSYGQTLGPSIRVFSRNGSSPLQFMFIPGAIGQLNYVSSLSFNYAGEPYTVDDTATTGGVILTEHDTLRNIISGTFSFNAERSSNRDHKCRVHDGVFTNVRY